MDEFWERLSSASGQADIQRELLVAQMRAANRIQQQQWQRGFSSMNPFTHEPERMSAVAAEAYGGNVIEGVARRVESGTA